MPINIADQFKVNVSLPVDSRIVASGSNKDLIQFKYDGLRVFDTSNRTTYIWNAITSTFSVVDINGSGQTNYMARWSSSTGLTSSGIYYAVGSSINKGNVGINTSSPQAVLQINSDTGASQPFVIHKGVSTLLAYNFHSSSGDSYFNVSVGSGAIRFSDYGHIDFLTRSAGNPAINSTTDANLAFQIQSGTGWAYLFKNLILSGNTTAPNNSSLFLRSQNIYSTAASSSSNGPDVAWYNDDNTGIFHPAKYQIGISLGGFQRFKFHEQGLLIGGNALGSPLNPSNKLQIDNGTGIASNLQFTAGTTTGVLSSNGFLIGISSLGYPTFQSRFGNNPFSFGFSNGNYFHKIDRNTFTIYSSSNGESLSTVTSTGGYRTVYGTKSNFNPGSGSLEVGSISVPNSCYFSIEATFTSAVPSPKGFKTNKLIASYTVDSVGNITSQNSTDAPFTSASGISLAMLRSTSNSGYINPGYFITTTNTVKFMQSFGIGSGHSTVAFTAVINTGVGT
jgi:hypothetical protein